MKGKWLSSNIEIKFNKSCYYAAMFCFFWNVYQYMGNYNIVLYDERLIEAA